MFATSGAVGQGHAIQSGAEELDELIHHAFLAQHLCDGQDQVGGSDTLLELSMKLETNHVRQEHIHRLTEHDRFGFDAAHAPARPHPGR